MTPNQRLYYHQRQPTGQLVNLDLLKQIFTDYYIELDDKGYFDEWLGVWDNWDRTGGKVTNPKSYVLRKLRKDLWPIHEKIVDYSEEDLLSMIEFIFDHVSAPLDGAGSYDTGLAQEQYLNELNPVISDYGVGLSLSNRGEIVINEPAGMDFLLQANIPQPETVDKEIFKTIENSIAKFRRRTSSIDDRKAVINELAGIFEELQKQKSLSQVLNSKDESAIFEIANRFAIRHRDQKQIKNYDKDIWMSWMFYYYLATIHAVLRLILKQEAISNESDELWVQVLDEISRQNNVAYSLLRMAVPSLARGNLTLSFKFAFHAKRIDDPKIKDLIAHTAKQVYGKDLKIDIKLMPRQIQSS